MKNPTNDSSQQRDNLIWRQMSATVHGPLARVRCSWLLAVVLAAWALAPRSAQGQATPNPPGQISYQGFLTDANGIPLATNTPKNYVVTFLIYNTPTGGTPLWGENQTVTVNNGYFSVLLGQGSAVSGVPNTNNLTTVFTGSTASQRYIGLTVAGIGSNPTEIQPRLQLLASPYALLAANANSIVANTGAQVLITQGPSVGINETPNGNDSLDVKGNVGINGSSTLDFGQGMSGQDPNAGKIGYEAFSTNALDIVGAGTTGNRKVKLWAEAGTSTTGPLGIEIDTPAAPLDVNGGAFFSAGSGLGTAGGRPGISIWYDTADNTGQIQSYKPGTADSNLTFNAAGGNVGVGILSPQAKLHVNGSTYMDGYAGILAKNVLEFGRGVAGKQGNAGEIGYQTFDTALDIVGAGTTSANRIITMYAEGGTTFTGPVTTSSAISGGSIGAGGSVNSGDVFTLNGAGHYNNNRMYLRGNGDFNHWLSYDDTFGTDGPSLTGFSGGLLGTSSGGYDWTLLWNTGGNVTIRNELVTYGEIYAYGAVYGFGGVELISDRAVKQDFEEVDAKAVLAKLDEMPITKWSYTNTPSVRHLGPVAQDFAASFGYGMVSNDNKHISLGDEVGVSLVAIKGLDEKLKEKDAELQALKQQVADLKTVVDSLVKGQNVNK